MWLGKGSEDASANKCGRKAAACPNGISMNNFSRRSTFLMFALAPFDFAKTSSSLQKRSCIGLNDYLRHIISCHHCGGVPRIGPAIPITDLIVGQARDRVPGTQFVQQQHPVRESVHRTVPRCVPAAIVFHTQCKPSSGSTCCDAYHLKRVSHTS